MEARLGRWHEWKDEEEEEEEEVEVEEVGILECQPHEQVVTTTTTTTITSITTSSNDMQGQDISETRDSSSFSEVEKMNITLPSFDPVISSDLSSLFNVMIGSEEGQEISETSSFSEAEKNITSPFSDPVISRVLTSLDNVAIESEERQDTFEMKDNPMFSDTEKKNITLPSSDIVIPRDLTPPYNGTIDSQRAGIITENIQLVKELYLESIYQKTPTQGFYCPNCRSCIQRVLILDTVRQEPEDPAQPLPHIDDRFRCPTCFSFLIAIGSWLIPCWMGGEARDPTGPMFQPKPGIAGDAGQTRARDPTGPMLQPKPGTAGDAGQTRARDPTGPMFQPKPGTAGDAGQTRGPMLQPKPGIAGDVGQTRDPSYRLDIPDEVRDGSSDKPYVVQPGASTGPTGPTTSAPAVPTPAVQEPGISKTWDILKSIVYGGLIEYIASLGVVTSSASADATTVSILALSVANLIGGLFVLVHQIWDLKSEQENTNALVDRYYLSLGERDNFYLHVCIAILSFIIFGIVPPLAYGLTFYETSEKDLALVAVAGASVICITLLSIAKTYIQRPNPYLTYLKTVVYYLSTGALTSVIAYLVGFLILKLLEKLGLSSESSLGFNLMLPEMSLIEKPRFGSY